MVFSFFQGALGTNITVTLFLRALSILWPALFHLWPASVIYARGVDDGINDTEGT